MLYEIQIEVDGECSVVGVFADSSGQILSVAPGLAQFRGLQIGQLLKFARKQGWRVVRLDSPPVEEVRLSDPDLEIEFLD